MGHPSAYWALTLAENTAQVFIVATANQIEGLPPELIRKGRVDEIFFVDLPDAESRRGVITLHLDKRSQRPSSFELTELVTATEGFLVPRLSRGLYRPCI